MARRTFDVQIRRKVNPKEAETKLCNLHEVGMKKKIKEKRRERQRKKRNKSVTRQTGKEENLVKEKKNEIKKGGK